MSGLFGNALPTEPRTKPKLKGELPPNHTGERPAPGPVFGTPEWTFCPCGGWAVYFFPLVGGIRRCTPCAKREGRFREFPKR
jgi:hypothetical protein